MIPLGDVYVIGLFMLAVTYVLGIWVGKGCPNWKTIKEAIKDELNIS